VELELLHMSALRWKDSPSSADIPGHTPMKSLQTDARLSAYVISWLRGVTGGERPEVFEWMCSLRATESESRKKSWTEIRRGRWCRKEGVSRSRDEIKKVYSTQIEIVRTRTRVSPSGLIILRLGELVAVADSGAAFWGSRGG